mgnify:CR=1 FL=1
MATRQKKTIVQGVTAEMANEAFAQSAKADAEYQKITAEIELQCARIREKKQNEVSTLLAQRDEAFTTLQAYAIENQAELFTKKKSLEMVLLVSALVRLSSKH